MYSYRVYPQVFHCLIDYFPALGFIPHAQIICYIAALKVLKVLNSSACSQMAALRVMKTLMTLHTLINLAWILLVNSKTDNIVRETVVITRG